MSSIPGPGRRSASSMYGSAGSSSGEGSPEGGRSGAHVAMKQAWEDAGESKRPPSPSVGSSSWPWPWSSRPLRSLGLVSVFLLGPLAFALVILLLQGGGGRFLTMRGGALATQLQPPSSAACMCDRDGSSTTIGNSSTSEETPIDPSILARRAAFLPSCEASALPGTGWGPMVFRDLPGGGMKPAGEVTVAPPTPDFVTDYVTVTVLKNVCIETPPSRFRYVFVGRNETWLDESPELKLAGPEWADSYEESFTPTIRFTPSAKTLSPPPRWVPGVTMRVRVRSPNPNHHMMENVLHESAVQVLEEYEEKIGGKVERFLADQHFYRALEANYALAAHLTHVTLSITPEADLIALEGNTVTCFETLIINQMWIWPLRHLFPRSRIYTDSQVNRALAAYRTSAWDYLKVPPPRVSRPMDGEEIRFGVYARKHMWHRKIVNMDEVVKGVVETVKEEGILGIANVDVYVGTHGGHGALSLFLPRCAAFLEIDSECGHGHWSPASTYSSAIGFLADWQRSNDTLVKVSLVPKDYSLKFGFPQGSNVSTSCAGLRGSMGYVGYNYSPDFEGWVKGVVEEWMDEGRQEWMRSYCDEEGIGSVQLST
eukprot:jgi/Chlat1/1530/Chrsp122S01820